MGQKKKGLDSWTWPVIGQNFSQTEKAAAFAWTSHKQPRMSESNDNELGKWGDRSKKDTVLTAVSENGCVAANVL